MQQEPPFDSQWLDVRLLAFDRIALKEQTAVDLSVDIKQVLVGDQGLGVVKSGEYFRVDEVSEYRLVCAECVHEVSPGFRIHSVEILADAVS